MKDFIVLIRGCPRPVKSLARLASLLSRHRIVICEEKDNPEVQAVPEAKPESVSCWPEIFERRPGDLYTDSELQAYVELLNALEPERAYSHTGWRQVKAQKEHLDIFGRVIAAGEYYFSRGPDTLSDTKLSSWSMEALVNCVLEFNPFLKRLAQERKLAREAKLRAVYDAANPLRRILDQ